MLQIFSVKAEVHVVTDELSYIEFPNAPCVDGQHFEWELSVHEKGLGVIIYINETILNTDNEYLAISAGMSFEYLVPYITALWSQAVREGSKSVLWSAHEQETNHSTAQKVQKYEFLHRR